MVTSIISITLLLCIAPHSKSFQPSSTVLSRSPTQASNRAQLYHATNAIDEEVSDVSRRQIFQLATKGAVAASVLIGMPGASLAVVPSPADLKRLQVGHSRVQYLLKNWDTLTESCNNKAMSATESKQVVRTEGGGGGFCDKNPLVVQEYLGYKSTTDPLFKADALMLRAVPLVDESVVDEADYVDLVEQYRDKADQTALLAYTSSWGEANPNGSKDTTDDYLNQTKKVVEESEVLLRKIMSALKLEVLPPSKK
ncbi:hypothetical protein ACHAXR_001432 [Thalassiosira sp. AJA248-18]